MEELRIDRTNEHDEIDSMTLEFLKDGGVVEQCPKQMTRQEYLRKMRADQANGVKQELGKYSNTTISHKYGSF